MWLFNRNVVNRCNLYIFLYGFYVIYSAYTTSGVTAILMGGVLVSSLYYFFYANYRYRMPYYMKGLNVLVCMFFLYGMVYLLWGEDVMTLYGTYVDRRSYLMTFMISLLPIYAFFVFTKKKLLTLKLIKNLLPIFLCMTVFEYLQAQNRLIALADMLGSTQTEFTINTGYVFVSLLPLIALPYKKKLIQYALWTVVLIFVLMAVKRGAILITLICTVFFLWRSVTNASTKERATICILSLVLIIVGIKAFLNQIDNSEYFALRLANTMEADSSGRGSMFDSIFQDYLSENNFLYLLIGRGANSTMEIVSSRAHNDWLQILSDQGLLGVVVYCIYFFCLYKLYIRNRRDPIVGVSLGVFLLITFLKTLFSMSYADYSMYASMAIGFIVAHLDNEQKK